ncbi:MAG: exosortase/archaeosortase family protein [Candidatus Nanohaloarchaea archaeon]
MKLIDDLKNDIEQQDERLKRTGLFIGKMLIAGLVFQTILYIYPSTYGIQSFLASVSASGLDLLGIHMTHESFMVIGPKQVYVITQDCLGWKSMAALTALIFASSESLRQHWKTLLGGLIFIAVLNYIRILTTIYLSYIGLISFDIIHTLFWKWGLTFAVLSIWILWFQRYNKTDQEAI